MAQNDLETWELVDVELEDCGKPVMRSRVVNLACDKDSVSSKAEETGAGEESERDCTFMIGKIDEQLEQQRELIDSLADQISATIEERNRCRFEKEQLCEALDIAHKQLWRLHRKIMIFMTEDPETKKEDIFPTENDTEDSSDEEEMTLASNDASCKGTKEETDDDSLPAEDGEEEPGDMDAVGYFAEVIPIPLVMAMVCISLVFLLLSQGIVWIVGIVLSCCFVGFDVYVVVCFFHTRSRFKGTRGRLS